MIALWNNAVMIVVVFGVIGLFQWFAFKKGNLLGWLICIINIGILFALGIKINMPLNNWFGFLLTPYIFLSIGLFLIVRSNYFYNSSKKIDSIDMSKAFDVVVRTNKNRKKIIKDINRGVAVFGASGSGKSESIIKSLLEHYAKYKFSGILHDYKDFELSEIAYPIFKKENIKYEVFSITDVERSVRINPIDPMYIETEADVNGLVKSFLLNMGQSGAADGSSQFFNQAAESLLAGVIWRLKEISPTRCNLPFVISLLLNPNNLHDKNARGEYQGNFGKLIRFLEPSPRAMILASTFLTGVGSERQTAGVFSTLSNFLRTLASPEIYYVLSANEINLNLNAEDNRMVLALVNSPGQKEPIISPINALVVEACLSKMSVRNRDPSFVVLDEAPTIKIMNLPQRVATLRSYGVSFVYCMQDKVQGIAQWGGKEYHIKEILANLSTQFMGKINDPDTGKFYQNYFEIVKREQKSFSKKDGIFGKSDSRITTSKKDEAKIRGFEFFRLRAGEFVMFTDGKDDRFRFFYDKKMERVMPPVKRIITKEEIENHFNDIMKDAAIFFK